jgi:hypothetical protein
MEHKRWVPVPYYYNDPLSKTQCPTKLPHKLGFMPSYLKKQKSEKDKNLTPK